MQGCFPNRTFLNVKTLIELAWFGTAYGMVYGSVRLMVINHLMVYGMFSSSLRDRPEIPPVLFIFSTRKYVQTPLPHPPIIFLRLILRFCFLMSRPPL